MFCGKPDTSVVIKITVERAEKFEKVSGIYFSRFRFLALIMTSCKPGKCLLFSARMIRYGYHVATNTHNFKFISPLGLYKFVNK